MNIHQAFESLKRRKECALITYVMAGFPTLERSMQLIQQLCDGGADLIEIGVPFSDPIADGPTIQYAGTEALRQGVTLNSILLAARNIRTDKPLILMSYLNPLLAYGRKRLFEDMKHAGFSGLIVPDLPADESDETVRDAEKSKIDVIFLVTPVSGRERIRNIASRSRGFLYCVSLTGTTGVRTVLPSELSEFLSDVRKAAERKGKESLPIAVGFGISTPDHVRLLKKSADGVIVGSRIIDAVRKGEDVPGLVSELKEATK